MTFSTIMTQSPVEEDQGEGGKMDAALDAAKLSAQSFNSKDFP